MTWLEGDLDAALAHGKKSGRMLLVWWTAGWCPPCNELKRTVFDQPAFAARADNLVLLTVDGDTRGAQALGERLQVRSYPSTVLLDTDGRERLRFPGGLTVAEFCRVLDMAMVHPTGIAAIADRAERDETLSDAEYELLAYHWWAIDEVHAPGDQRGALLQKAFLDCPTNLGGARLRLLVQLLGARRAGMAFAEENSRRTSREFLRSALASSDARFSNLYFLLVDLALLDGLAANGTPERKALDRALLDAGERILRGPSLTMTEELIALMAVLILDSTWKARTSPDPAMQERVRIAAAKADRTSKVTAERQTAINMAGHLLKAAGLIDEAREMFTNEIKRSPYAGYFMPYLAQMSLEAKQTQQALDWWRSAYESTPPGAARFSRGARYISQLVDLVPSERALVAREVRRVLTEIAADPAPLVGINRSSMEMVLASLARLAN